MLKLPDALNRLADAMDRFPARLGQELHITNESFIVGVILGVVVTLLLIELFRRK